MTKADRADAFKQLPLRAEDERAAAATLGNPAGGELYGFPPLPHPVNFSGCHILSILNLPHVGCYDDVGGASQIDLVPEALLAGSRYPKRCAGSSSWASSFIFLSKPPEPSQNPRSRTNARRSFPILWAKRFIQ